MRYQNMENELLENLDRLHTTELGVIRIKKNLSLNIENVIEWCKERISLSNAEIIRIPHLHHGYTQSPATAWQALPPS